MRLYLAVAVLMLAFVAYTEAQDAPTFEDKMTQLGQDVSNAGQTLIEKAKTAFNEFQNSEFAVNSRNWLEGLVEKAKAGLSQ